MLGNVKNSNTYIFISWLLRVEIIVVRVHGGESRPFACIARWLVDYVMSSMKHDSVLIV